MGEARVNDRSGTQDADPDVPHPPHWLRPAREWVFARPGGAWLWRGGIALLGLAIVAGGALLIPLPGPGWAIVFLGLAVWATEFVWAQRLLRFGRRLLTDWTEWVKRQSRWIQALIGLVGLLFLAALAWFAWWFFIS